MVGVAGETRYRELTQPQPTLYVPARQFPGPVPSGLALRTHGDPASLIPQARQVLSEMHPQWAVTGGGSLRQLLAAPLARPRYGALLVAGFALITLLLSGVGIYGPLAATVRQRTREIEIRMALGAGIGEVRGLVLRQGMRLAAWGCAIGTAGALLGTRALRSMLFGVSPTDPLVLAAGILVILLCAAGAAYLPARRASTVDPTVALRAE